MIDYFFQDVVQPTLTLIVIQMYSLQRDQYPLGVSVLVSVLDPV